MNFFSKRNEEIEKIEKNNIELTAKLEELKKELEESRKKVEEVREISNSSAPEEPNLIAKEIQNYAKQWQLMEKNLKNLEEENFILKHTVTVATQIIPKNSWESSYLVDINLIYQATKFSELKKILVEAGYNYVQDLNEDLFTTLLKDVKGTEEARKKFLCFKNGFMDWEVRAALKKGDKISKAFQKHRKFTNFVAQEYIEFVSDLDGFDFDSLFANGFTKKAIGTLVERYNEYNTERKYN